jgi:endonuclease G, mitochondrial
VRRFAPPDESTVLKVVDSILPIESYADRKGYIADFIDDEHSLPLPGPGRHADKLAELNPDIVDDGQDHTEIKYTHFSVRQHKDRRMPLYSIVNIDGSKRVPNIERTDIWRRDPRIALEYQNHRDAYGNWNEGLFSRGHMTRREDPNWGTEKIATLADLDTFHVTNAVPQQQGFNAGVWLSLEDYVLDNTDDANLKVSVLTGPIFDDNDPGYFGIKVPTSFYKIVAFKHFRTKQLTTIGYRRSQSTFLATGKRPRFVFGNFDDTQVSIASIAEDTGLELHHWIEKDVLVQADLSLEIRLSSATDMYLAK